jgi:hypothetical protein
MKTEHSELDKENIRFMAKFLAIEKERKRARDSTHDGIDYEGAILRRQECEMMND